MTSILTNNSAMVALQTLSATQMNLTKTQNEISTGLKVASAKDDAATWSVATHMRADVSNLQQVSTNLGTADDIVGTAMSAASNISSLISQIRAKVTAEADPSQNTTAVKNDIQSLVNQITQAVAGASYNGVNLLNGTHSGGISVASTVVSNASGLSQVQFISVNPTAPDLLTSGTGQLHALSQLTNASVTAGNLQTQLQVVDAALNIATKVAAALGSAQSNIEGQKTFTNHLSDTLTTGVGTLVDADMTAESARLSALQTQQQLGTQALSIANSAPQAILSLFR